ncbi:hypothetical protein [Hansschlegelia zhihuaiae]|uniref:TetR/AcrR family transcriptional regulator n=1 Tax=Hansschlegelia zhihuaiae TaxID=405005 RepID=A0A4Q0M2S5_9HYPH|nr:hypothetical protein [Hansschlegelia zhihuaiae]RXF67201.1 hypothetical protein EK403_21585 [Hansschlegelia zhihuaiae]
MDKIVLAGRAVLARGSGTLNVKLVAEELGVTYGSISEKLRRADTTLEQELAKIFMAAILKPHAPGDKWEDRLKDLFATALSTASSAPELARMIIPMVAQGPLIEPQFADRLLYTLRDSGLGSQYCAAGYDIVLAGLCGMLTVSFPEWRGDPAAWSKGLKADLEALEQDRWPSIHYARSQLAARAADKATLVDGQPSAEAAAFAAMIAGMVIAEIKRLHLKTNL